MPANRGTSFLDCTQVANTFIGIELGDLDARSVYRVLTQLQSTYDAANGMLKGLETPMAKEQQETSRSGH